MEPVRPDVGIALTATAAQRGRRLGLGELGRLSGSARCGQDGTGLAAGQADALDLEGRQRGREVLAQQ